MESEKKKKFTVITVEKDSHGCFLYKINGRIVTNPRSSPQGAATFASEKEAKEWYEQYIRS